MNDLVDTTEMYLKSVIELEEQGVVPLRARISERLNHSGPTVSQTVARMERDGLLSVSGDRHRIVYPFAWPRSPDGTKVYVGYGPASPDGMATSVELRVFDTSAWQQVGSIRTSFPFWSASMSEDGKFVYAVVPEEHRVLVLDATTLRETGTINVGRAPALALGHRRVMGRLDLGDCDPRGLGLGVH